jgi:hypothetical protein
MAVVVVLCPLCHLGIGYNPILVRGEVPSFAVTVLRLIWRVMEGYRDWQTSVRGPAMTVVVVQCHLWGRGIGNSPILVRGEVPSFAVTVLRPIWRVMEGYRDWRNSVRGLAMTVVVVQCRLWGCGIGNNPILVQGEVPSFAVTVLRPIWRVMEGYRDWRTSVSGKAMTVVVVQCCLWGGGIGNIPILLRGDGRGYAPVTVLRPVWRVMEGYREWRSCVRGQAMAGVVVNCPSCMWGVGKNRISRRGEEGCFAATVFLQIERVMDGFPG